MRRDPPQGPPRRALVGLVRRTSGHEPTEQRVTVIAGQVADQSALHGVLAKVRDVGPPLISVRRMDPT